MAKRAITWHTELSKPALPSLARRKSLEKVVTRQLSDGAVTQGGAESSVESSGHERSVPVGDILITQVRSGFTSSRHTRYVLHSLGLRRVGHRVLQDSRAGAKLHHQLRTVKHLVNVHPLALIRDGPSDSYVGSYMLSDISEVEYAVKDKPARSFEVSTDEYFDVEVHNGFVAMSWPTAIPLPLLLQRFEAVAPPTDPDVAILYSKDRGREVHSGKSGMQALRSDPAEYTFARLEYPDFTVTWKSGNVTSSSRPQRSIPYGEFGWLSSRYSRADINVLLRDTATVGVGLKADELADKAEFVKKYVQQGSVLRSEKTL